MDGFHYNFSLNKLHKVCNACAHFNLIIEFNVTIIMVARANI